LEKVNKPYKVRREGSFLLTVLDNKRLWITYGKE